MDVADYTRIPNALLSVMMIRGDGAMGESELRVSLAVCRQTWGWQKDRDVISITQLVELTGLSRQGVVDGITAALARGIIGRAAVGNSFEYFLLVNDVDQSTECTSQQNSTKSVNNVDHLLVNKIDTQKKGLKKKETTPTPPRQQPAPHPPGGGNRKQPEPPNRTPTFVWLAEHPDGPLLENTATLNKCAGLDLAGVQAEWEQLRKRKKDAGGGLLATIILAPGWRPPKTVAPQLDELARRIKAAQHAAATHPDPAQRSEASQLAYALTLKRARVMDGAP